MAIQTRFSGYIRRYDGDNIISEKRFSTAKTVTEYGGQGRIKLASSHSGISIMPAGLSRATAIYIEPNKNVNVTLYGAVNASFDIMANGDLLLNGSVSDVQLKSISTGSTEVKFDISGQSL